MLNPLHMGHNATFRVRDVNRGTSSWQNAKEYTVLAADKENCHPNLQLRIYNDEASDLEI
ncbi:hypothetical protein T08_12963 [Trichinella sp. T8]|nr:hypothetical protein T08_12963 [Trichinella sp. T8]